MLKRIAVRKDWTISMSEFRNFAEKYQWKIDELEEENRKLKKECEENDYLVEDNARWMKKCAEKTMEIKKLKSDLAYERTMLDNVRAEYKSLQNVKEKLNIKVASLEWEIKWLNYTIEKLREELSAYDREYFDEDKKASEIYKEYQHSMWFSDFWWG